MKDEPRTYPKPSSHFAPHSPQPPYDQRVNPQYEYIRSDELAALRAEIERLRAALEFIAQYSSDPTAQHTAQDDLAKEDERWLNELLRRTPQKEENDE